MVTIWHVCPKIRIYPCRLAFLWSNKWQTAINDSHGWQTILSNRAMMTTAKRWVLSRRLILNQGQTTRNWKLKSQIHQQLWSMSFSMSFWAYIVQIWPLFSGLLYSFMVQTDSSLEHARIYKNRQNWPHKHVIISVHQGVSNDTFATLLRSTKGQYIACHDLYSY